MRAERERTQKRTKWSLRLVGPRTWSQIKEAIEGQGVLDDDHVWSIDVGPYAGKIVVERDEAGVEVGDDCSELID